MKTFDFAYWISSLDVIQEDAPPTDRFPLKAATILHGLQEGMAEATRRITREEGPIIGKVTIVEL